MKHTYYDVFFIGFASVLIFLVSTNVYSIFLGPGGLSGKLAWSTLLPMMAITVLYFGPFLRAAAAVPEISTLITIALVSAAWSYAPATTVERAIPLIVTSAFAMTLAGVLSLRSIILLFAIVAALAMFGSMIAIATIPGARGIPPWENTWNGVFNHKNALGEASVLAVIFSASAISLTKGRARAFFIATILISLFLLAASESRSSQLITLIIGFAFITRFLIKRYTLVWAIFLLLFLGGLIGTIWLLMNTGTLDPVFAAFERKPTLSGRTPLWSLLIQYISDEFWFGYGYRGFWEESSYRVLKITTDLKSNYTPFYSHNGLLETWLHLGLVGVLLTVAAFVRTFRASFVGLAHLVDQKIIVASYLLIVAYILSNIAESNIISRSSLSWMSFVAVSTKLCLVARAIRIRPPSKLNEFGKIAHNHMSKTQVNG